MKTYLPALLALVPLTAVGCVSPDEDSSDDDVLGPTTILWQQPSLDGAAGNLYVPLANKQKPAVGKFGLLLWQPNPKTSTGLLVPTTWAAGDKTGFYPTSSSAELAFQNKIGSTTAQAQGDTVGAYLNSADLIDGSNEYKMMITPQVSFSGTAVFATHTSLRMSLDVQVPTASDAGDNGSDTYANSDLLFEDPKTGVKISYSGGFFHHGTKSPPAECNIGVDPATQNFMVNCPLEDGVPFLTVGINSTVHQFSTWRGFMPFAYRVSNTQFATALLAVQEHARQQHPTFTMSLDPADYLLTEWHLNAELHYETGPATLGFSMKDARLTAN